MPVGHEGVVGVGLRTSSFDPRVWGFKDLVIPSSSVLTLNSSPYTIVEAPGPNLILEYLGGMIFYDFESAAYDGIGGSEDLEVNYTDADGAAVSTTLETTGFLDQTDDQLRSFKPITTDYTPVVNAPLVLSLQNGDITTGDSPLRFKFFYRVYETDLG